MEKLTLGNFLLELNQKLNGRKYKAIRWSNYPNSFFYYYDDDNVMYEEIAIWTDENHYGIYV